MTYNPKPRARHYTLRGRHPLYAAGALIALTGGTVSHCRQEMRWRMSDGGWSDLVITLDQPKP